MKVTIIGAGAVGRTLAYSLLFGSGIRELLLVGRRRALVEAEVMDLRHAARFSQSPIRVRAGEIEDARGSEVVVICASAPGPKLLEDRNQLAVDNQRLMEEILPPLAKAAPDCKLLMVSNPVDSLTWLALQLTGFPPSRVMGTGTLVDSFRLRDLLFEQVRINPFDLRVYILGEHGETQFAAMSVALAGGELINNNRERREFSERAKHLGVEIFNMKGNTCYAIARAASMVIHSIIQDDHATIPLSIKVDGFLGIDDVCLSLPAVVGANGIERILHPRLDTAEQQAFHRCAGVVRSTIASFQSEARESRDATAST